MDEPTLALPLGQILALVEKQGREEEGDHYYRPQKAVKKEILGALHQKIMEAALDGGKES